MTKRLFSYAMNEEDEAESIRLMLESNGIEFYETPASRWGFSKAAIWLKNDGDFDRAKALLKAHETDYAEQARQRYQAETGYNPNATFKEQTLFLFKHLYRKRRMLLWVVIGFGLIFWYFSVFFSLFN